MSRSSFHHATPIVAARTPIWRCVVISVCAASLLAQPSHAQQPGTRFITGAVVDSSGVAVVYANVVTARGARTVADSLGRFQITMRLTERIVLDIRRIGFMPARVELPAGGDTSVVVVLARSVQVLEATGVQAALRTSVLERRGFYRRLEDREKGINAGHFITPEEIELRKPRRITHMLEGVGGVRLIRHKEFCSSDFDPHCWAVAGPNGCPMTVYIDGIRMNKLGTVASTTYAEGVDEVVPPTNVSGIEVYRTAGRIPPEYAALAGTCGAVLIWTK